MTRQHSPKIRTVRLNISDARPRFGSTKPAAGVSAAP